MKACALFIGMLAVLLFINTPAETAQRTAASLGISPGMAICAVVIVGLILLIRGSRTPKGR